MGGKQLCFSDYEQTTAKKQTKREKFLAEMEVVVPWDALIGLIGPHFPKTSKKGGVLRTRWPRCCGSICCSSGTRSVTRPWKRL